MFGFSVKIGRKRTPPQRVYERNTVFFLKKRSGKARDLSAQRTVFSLYLSMRDCSAARVLRKRGGSCKRFVIRGTPRKRDFFSLSALFIAAKIIRAGSIPEKCCYFRIKTDW